MQQCILDFMELFENSKFKAITYLTDEYSITITRYGGIFHPNYDKYKLFEKTLDFDEDKESKSIVVGNETYKFDDIFYT